MEPSTTEEPTTEATTTEEPTTETTTTEEPTTEATTTEEPTTLPETSTLATTTEELKETTEAQTTAGTSTTTTIAPVQQCKDSHPMCPALKSLCKKSHQKTMKKHQKNPTEVGDAHHLKNNDAYTPNAKRL